MSSPRRNTTRIAAAAVLLALAATGACIGKQRIAEVFGIAANNVDGAHANAAGASTDAAITTAIAAAADSLRTHYAEAAADPAALQRAAFLAAITRPDAALARTLAPPLPTTGDDLELLRAHAELLALEGDLAAARALAWQHATQFEQHRPVFVRDFYTYHARDTEAFPTEIRTLAPDENLTSITHLDRGTSLLFRLRNGGTTTHVLKPDQTVQLSNYRGEIASARLCALIFCEFDIPTSDEVRIAQTDFLQLTGLTSVEQIATTFVRESTRLIFSRTDDDPTRWLYGVRKAWIDSFSTIPIEDTARWSDSTRVTANAEVLARNNAYPLWADLLTIDPDRYRRLSQHMGDIDQNTLARQISSVHVFDVLINNWDRYRFDRPGANLHIVNGRLLSIDNGASFQRSEEERRFREVQSRIRSIEVFSRRTIDAIRWMDVEAIAPLLFAPSPRAEDDDQRLAYFEVRRQWLLGYVDALVATHGEQAVYRFE